MKIISPLAILAILTLASVGTSAARAEDSPVLKHFDVKGTQYTLLKEFFWNRFHASAGFASCVRRFYSKKELLDHPLPDEAYGILSFFKKSMTPDRKNTFAFLNSHGEAWKCRMIGGYCMGITVLERDLNLLLIFDPQQSRVKLPKFSNNQEKSEYFEKILWDVVTTKKPAFVPGFADLFSFTADPVVKNIFLGAVPWNWADMATIPKIAIGVLAKSRRLIPEAEMLEQVNRLIAARKKGYNASLYLGGVENHFPSSKGVRSRLRLESALKAPAEGALDRAPTEKELEEAMDPEMLAALEPELWAALERGRRQFNPHSKSIAPEAAVRSVGDAIAGAKDSENTYIHVVQVQKIKKISPRKWEIATIDPNAFAPDNIGTLKIDLDGKPQIYWEGATATLELNSFGQLPGDREHLDEIVENLIFFDKENPNVFSEKPKKKPKKKKPGSARS